MPSAPTLGAAVSFLEIWMVMMAAMMLPSLLPMLRRYHLAAIPRDGTRLTTLTAIVGAGYFSVWAGLGVAAFTLSAAVSLAAAHLPALVRVAPVAAAVTALLAGALQYTAWKAHHLACCRVLPTPARSVSADAGTAWRRGIALGVHCCYCSCGLTAILFAFGFMNLGAMALVTAAITVERLAKDGERVARAIGAASIGAGLLLMVRAVAPG